MKTLSIRIPDDMMSALQVVGREEKIEASTAMRKLVRIGYESYVGNLYRQGKVTLRDAAALLDLNQMETLDLFLEAGISGNLGASDILTSLEKMGVRSCINRDSAPISARLAPEKTGTAPHFPCGKKGRSPSFFPPPAKR